MKTSQKKTVLIVSPYCFSENRIAFARVNQIHEELKALGFSVFRVGYSNVLGLSGECEGEVQVPLPRVLSGDAYARRDSLILWLVQKCFHKLLALLRRDEWHFWAFASCLRLLTFREKADFVIASSPPLSSLHLATWIARRSGARLIADFRDIPISLYASPRGNKRLARLIEAADAYMVTSAFQANVIGECNSNLPCLVSGGFFSGPAADRRSDTEGGGLLRLIYGGSLYVGQRDLSPLFHALRSYPGRIELSLYIDMAEIGIVSALSQEYGVSSLLKIFSLVSRRAFFEACQSADIGIIIVGENVGDIDHENAIPGKYYEYVRAGLKVLSIGPNGCAMEAELARSGLGVAICSSASKDGFVDGLHKVAALVVDPAQRDRYRPTTALKGLIGFLDGGCSK